MEKHIYFVRHGESQSNVDGIYRAREARLTPQGESQAQTVAERIAKIGVEAIISSDFPRALATASAISERIGLNIESTPLLGEWVEPSINTTRHKDEPEARAVFDTIFTNRDDSHAKHSDEESFHELRTRAEAALKLIEEHPAKRICVVTHGAFMRLIAGVILFREDFSKPEFLDMFSRLLTTNTGITYAKNEREDRGWQILSWNDSAHLG